MSEIEPHRFLITFLSSVIRPDDMESTYVSLLDPTTNPPFFVIMVTSLVAGNFWESLAATDVRSTPVWFNRFTGGSGERRRRSNSGR